MRAWSRRPRRCGYAAGAALSRALTAPGPLPVAADRDLPPRLGLALSPQDPRWPAPGAGHSLVAGRARHVSVGLIYHDIAATAEIRIAAGFPGRWRRATSSRPSNSRPTWTRSRPPGSKVAPARPERGRRSPSTTAASSALPAAAALEARGWRGSVLHHHRAHRHARVLDAPSRCASSPTAATRWAATRARIRPTWGPWTGRRSRPSGARAGPICSAYSAWRPTWRLCPAGFCPPR